MGTANGDPAWLAVGAGVVTGAGLRAVLEATAVETPVLEAGAGVVLGSALPGVGAEAGAAVHDGPVGRVAVLDARLGTVALLDGHGHLEEADVPSGAVVEARSLVAGHVHGRLTDEVATHVAPWAHPSGLVAIDGVAVSVTKVQGRVGWARRLGRRPWSLRRVAPVVRTGAPAEAAPVVPTPAVAVAVVAQPVPRIAIEVAPCPRVVPATGRGQEAGGAHAAGAGFPRPHGAAAAPLAAAPAVAQPLLQGIAGLARVAAAGAAVARGTVGQAAPAGLAVAVGGAGAGVGVPGPLPAFPSRTALLLPTVRGRGVAPLAAVPAGGPPLQLLAPRLVVVAQLELPRLGVVTEGRRVGRQVAGLDALRLRPRVRTRLPAPREMAPLVAVAEATGAIAVRPSAIAAEGRPTRDRGCGWVVTGIRQLPRDSSLARLIRV